MKYVDHKRYGLKSFILWPIIWSRLYEAPPPTERNTLYPETFLALPF